MLLDQITAAAQPTARELEILAASPKGRIAKQFIAEYRRIESDREQTRKALLRQAWATLQAAGYAKFDRSGNAAYESGHSDYNGGPGEAGYYHFWGVVAPDGTEFLGLGSWADGIIPALEHAERLGTC